MVFSSLSPPSLSQLSLTPVTVALLSQPSPALLPQASAPLSLPKATSSGAPLPPLAGVDACGGALLLPLADTEAAQRRGSMRKQRHRYRRGLLSGRAR